MPKIAISSNKTNYKCSRKLANGIFCTYARTTHKILHIMGQPLEAILEKDGRLRLLNIDELKESMVGQSVTIRIVGIDETSDDRTELMGYTMLSQPILAKLWEDEPDIEDVWGDL